MLDWQNCHSPFVVRPMSPFAPFQWGQTYGLWVQPRCYDIGLREEKFLEANPDPYLSTRQGGDLSSLFWAVPGGA